MALLLLSTLSAGAEDLARGALAGPFTARPSTIDGTVSSIEGTVLHVMGGQFRIDVARATITSGDGPLAGPLPPTGIPVGARVVARVVVPEVIIAVFPPPPFQATHVVVFLPRDGQLQSGVQSVDPPSGAFVMLFHSIATNEATKWSGFSPNGPVRSIRDLSAGMFATVSVVSSPRAGGSGLLATSVEAYGAAAPRPIPSDRATEFDGTVESIPTASRAGGPPLGHWKISSRDVLVNGLTRLDSGIGVGSAVHVKGAFLVTLGSGGSLFATQFVAMEIRKK